MCIRLIASVLVFVFRGTFQDAGVIQQSIALNDALGHVVAQPQITPQSPNSTIDPVDARFTGVIHFFTLSNPAVILDAVKCAENGMERVLVIRLYEAYGGAAIGHISSRFPLAAYQECDILENVIEGSMKETVVHSSFTVQLRAFEIKSFLLYLSSEVANGF